MIFGFGANKMKMIFGKNPMFLFIYGILSKFYLIVIGASIVVCYWVFKGLSDAGIISKSEFVLVKVLHDVKGVAQYCTPKILRPKDFWNCLSNVPSYVESNEESDLSSNLEKLANELQEKQNNNSEEDPYHQKNKAH